MTNIELNAAEMCLAMLRDASIFFSVNAPSIFSYFRGTHQAFAWNAEMEEAAKGKFHELD